MIVVSFVIPTYNDEKYISYCLSTLCSLKERTYEFIVVNDGSTDNTAEICDRFASEDDRIKVIHNTNQGVSVARNLGMDAAAGKWLCFIDGDDYIDSEAIENSIFPQLDESCDIVYFLYDEDIQGRILSSKPSNLNKTVFDSAKEIESFHCSVWNRYNESTKHLANAGVNFSSPWGKVYRTEFLRKNDLHFTPGIIRAQDQLFNAHVYLHVEKIMLIPITGYVYRGRAGKALAFREELEENDKILLQEHDKYLRDITSDSVKYNYKVWLCAHVMFMLRLVYCNPNNPYGFWKRRSAFLDYVSMPCIKNAFREVDLHDAGNSRRLVLYLVKMRLFALLNLYYRNYKGAAFIAKIRRKMDS